MQFDELSVHIAIFSVGQSLHLGCSHWWLLDFLSVCGGCTCVRACVWVGGCGCVN